MTVLWDKIMTSLQCCGVSSYLDFDTDVPGSCCVVSDGNSTITPASCPDPASGALPDQMTNGCFDILIMGSVPAIASSLAVVALFQVKDWKLSFSDYIMNLFRQVAGVILSCCLARKVEEQREWYEMRSM